MTKKPTKKTYKELEAENKELIEMELAKADLLLEQKGEIDKLKRSRDRLVKRLMGAKFGKTYDGYDKDYPTKAEAIKSWIKWSEQE